MPRYPVLRPGLRAVRRGDGRVQVGLDPPERTVLPDDASTTILLGWLAAGRRGDGHEDADRLLADRVLADLVARGLVLDADDARRVVGAAAAASRHRPGALAGLCRDPRGGDERAARRGGLVVATTVPAGLAQELARRCGDSGVCTRGAGPPAASLLVTTGEPVRGVVDALARDDLPHLLVALHPDRVRIGPFVVPGQTACLRCLDAHAADRDPHRGAVLVRLEAEPVHEPLPAPYDPALASLALAWAVRDLASFLEGDEPATWSATVRVGTDLSVVRRRWLRHPGCGCAWGDALTG
ncbi:MAG: TOMM precursor leader peptide-binding protein [Nocardioides sp.]